MSSPALKAHDRDIARLAVPALGSLALEPTVALVDTAFVGRLGAEPLAALGIVTALLALSFVFFTAFSYTLTPKIAQLVGAGRVRETGDIVVTSLWVGASVGVLVTALLLSAPEFWVNAMNAPAEAVEPAVEYLRARAWGAPAVVAVLVGHGLFRGYQDTVTPLLVALAISVVNLILDPLFIFGFGWGLAGAGAASSVAQWSGAVLFLWWMATERGRAVGIVAGSFRGRLVPMLMGTGFFLGIRSLALTGIFALSAAVAAGFGVASVAAHQVVIQIWFFLALALDALAVAAQALVAKHLGAERPREAWSVSNRALLWGVVAGAVLGLMLIVWSQAIPGWFGVGGNVAEIATSLLIVAGVSQPISAAVFVFDGIFIGRQAWSLLVVSMVVSASFAAVALIVVQRTDGGALGVWLALVALIVVRALTLGIPYVRSRPAHA